jgi:hypothetical protein
VVARLKPESAMTPSTAIISLEVQRVAARTVLKEAPDLVDGV